MVTDRFGELTTYLVPAGVPGFEPLVRYQAFGESRIEFTVLLQAGGHDVRGLLVHEFIKRLDARLRAEGIEIPFPVRTVHLTDGRSGGP